MRHFSRSLHLCLVAVLGGALAAEGVLDSTFGQAGLVTTTFGGHASRANAVLLLSSGKIIAGGTAAGDSLDFALAAYHRNGTLDSSFGTAGLVTTDFAAGADEIRALLLTPAGKIIAVGTAVTPDPVGLSVKFSLARYNPDGTLDSTFGTAGVLTTFKGALAYAAVLQANGKIVAAGTTGEGIPHTDFALVRYNPDGTLDASFGTGGVVTTDFAGNLDEVHGLLLDPGGHLVAVGFTHGDGRSDVALARYNPDGTLDQTFGTGGIVTTQLPGNLAETYAAALTPGGKILVAGSSYSYITDATDFMIARYNGDGTLDSTFGTAGIATTDFAGGHETALALLLQPGGKIIAVGTARPGPADFADFALARYHADGSPDLSFGASGTLLTDITGDGQIDVANAAALWDGRLLAVGTARADFALARYRIK